MKKLYNKLLNIYGDSITVLSSTNNKNPLILNDEIAMVNLDKIGEEYKIDSKQYATSDALFITEGDENVKFYFIEFKNIDFESEKDRLMSNFYLKKCIKEMETCEYKCSFIKDLKKIKKHLIDKYQISLRMKPYESISLVGVLIKNYYKKLNDEEIKELLFKAEKNFIIVSKTRTEYNPYAKNKSNRRNVMKYFSFIGRLVPYHYKNVLIVNEKGFNNYFLNRNKDIL